MYFPFSLVTAWKKITPDCSASDPKHNRFSLVHTVSRGTSCKAAFRDPKNFQNYPGNKDRPTEGFKTAVAAVCVAGMSGCG